MTMLKQTAIKNQLPNEISATFQELKIGQSLRNAGVAKEKGFSCLDIFTFIFSMISKGKSLNQLTSGRESEEYFAKDTVYRFMNNPKYNWRKFLSAVSKNAISLVHSLTDSRTHMRVLIVDDSSYYRNRSQKVSKLAWLFDYAKQTSYKGFRMLTLILMDKWFTYPQILQQLSVLGIHTIGMLKNSSTRYSYQGRYYTLNELLKKSYVEHTSETIISSIQIRLISGLPIKVVFVKDNNKKSEWLAIMTTDIDLSSQEIVKRYGPRWNIETFFKATKSLLKLSKETQTRNCNALICHTTVVFIRYIILSWQQHCSNEVRSLGGMFYELLHEPDWSVALLELSNILLDVADKASKRLGSFIHCQLQQWFVGLPGYIKLYLPNLVCES